MCLLKHLWLLSHRSIETSSLSQYVTDFENELFDYRSIDVDANDRDHFQRASSSAEAGLSARMRTNRETSDK